MKMNKILYQNQSTYINLILFEIKKNYWKGLLAKSVVLTIDDSRVPVYSVVATLESRIFYFTYKRHFTVKLNNKLSNKH